jgi:hypothetical protein
MHGLGYGCELDAMMGRGDTTQSPVPQLAMPSEHTVDLIPHVWGQVVQINVLFPQVTLDIGRGRCRRILSLWTLIVH